MTFEQAAAQDTTAFSRMFHAMHESGVYLPPSAFETWFLSNEHTEADVDAIVAAAAAWANGR